MKQGRLRTIWLFRSDDPSAAASRRSDLANALIGEGYADDFVFIVELAYGELIGNVVRHAPGPVRVYVLAAAGTLTVKVVDVGPPLDLARAALPPPESETGRGLWLVATHARRLYVEQRDGRKAVVAEFAVAAADRG